MSAEIASTSLLDHVAETGFRASVITTYSCYFPFYEEVVLRRLMAAGCTHNVLMVDATRCAEAFAIEDRCPHLGFPLHQGTFESGMVTCHWHHARFDLAGGCTLDPWADDATAFEVTIEGEDVLVSPRPQPPVAQRWERRLRDGLEHNLTLVLAKAVHALLELPDGQDRLLRIAYEFGVRNRAQGWGSGLTVLTVTAIVLSNQYRVEQVDYERLAAGREQSITTFEPEPGEDPVELRLTRAVDPGDSLVEVLSPARGERVIVFQWAVVNDTGAPQRIDADAAKLKFSVKDASETKGKTVTALILTANNSVAPVILGDSQTVRLQAVFVVPSDAEPLELRFAAQFGRVKYEFSD